MSTSAAVGHIVRRAFVRAGIERSGRGAAHLLRHSLATGMLRNGASLEEIGQILRHRLTLDDIDWSNGKITVAGKGGRHDVLPLPHQVGEALAAYLQGDRPICATRRVFVRRYAPVNGFQSSAAVGHIVRRAFVRAGIERSGRGAAHLLRHSLATGMLRNGASLEEIGQILRHRSPDSTRIYAKVDLDALRPLAPAWPGGAP